MSLWSRLRRRTGTRRARSPMSLVSAIQSTSRRGLGYVLLFAPYALLFMYLSLGVHVDWIEGPMHDTLTSMGSYAIAVQLILAFFIGGE
jgi:hypothetical protein